MATWPEVDVDIVEGTSSINKLAEYDYNTKDSQWLLIWGIGEYGDTVPPRYQFSTFLRSWLIYL